MRQLTIRLAASLLAFGLLSLPIKVAFGTTAEAPGSTRAQLQAIRILVTAPAVDLDLARAKLAIAEVHHAVSLAHRPIGGAAPGYEHLRRQNEYWFARAAALGWTMPPPTQRERYLKTIQATKGAQP